MPNRPAEGIVRWPNQPADPHFPGACPQPIHKSAHNYPYKDITITEYLCLTGTGVQSTISTTSGFAVRPREGFMTKGKLSERQQGMVEFIRKFGEEKGYPPTIRQIGEAVGISSTSVVNYNLNKLEKDGLLTRDLKVSRGGRLGGSPATKGAKPGNPVSLPIV